MDLFQGHVISEKVDIWALGVILFKLAFFQTPFEDNKGNVDANNILKGLGDRKVGGAECGEEGSRVEWRDRCCCCCCWFFFSSLCCLKAVVCCVSRGGGEEQDVDGDGGVSIDRIVA